VFYIRIAFFSWESLHSIVAGGLSYVTTELAAALERKGNEVHVFTRIGPGQPHYECIHGVHYHRCGFDFHHNLVQEMHNMSNSMVETFYAVENYSGHFDIVHGHDWMVVPALDRIKRERNKKIVFTLHSTQFGRDGNHFHNGIAESIKGIEWHGTYIADRLITCSNKMKEEAQWLHRVPDWKMRIVPNGVAVHNYNGFIDPAWVKGRYGIGPLDPTILFVGRMTYQKGPDLLIEAMYDVVKDYGNAKLIMVGDGEMKPHLEHRVRELGIAHAVRFTGFIPENEKIDLFKACDAVVVPSRNEPFGIVVLEAWSAGKPVISTHGTGSGELIWHEVTGLQVYQNPSSIAWGIKRIFSDFEHARWMGRNGRFAVENEFNWDKCAERTLNVYKELV